MRKSVKITIQEEKNKRIVSTYLSNFDVQNTTTSLDLKKQIRETISYPCEEVSQTLWCENKVLEDQKNIPIDSKLDYVLLIKEKESENPITNSFW